MNDTKLFIGQEWYFFSKSTTYIIYDIFVKSYEHFDKKILCTEVEIKLKGSNNSIMICKPKDFNEYNCKLIKDVQTEQKVKVEIIPVPILNRLDRIK